jgi:hypothetical protein
MKYAVTVLAVDENGDPIVEETQGVVRVKCPVCGKWGQQDIGFASFHANGRADLDAGSIAFRIPKGHLQCQFIEIILNTLSIRK